ncbi:MAG: DUF2339 domain-containing protein [Chromatiaceae bacterium]
MSGYIFIAGIAGLLLGAWIGGAHMAPTWALMGAILGYALALGTRLRQIEQRVSELAASGRPTPSAAKASDEAEPPAPAAEEPLSIDWPSEPELGQPPLEPTATPRPAAPHDTRKEQEDAEARPPGPIAEAVQRLKAWVDKGNPVVQVGTLVLFFGVAFLVKYAAERDLVPIELRLTGVALGGLVLLALGWRLRVRTGIYATVLQGAGIGVIYLTVYAAAKLYGLIPPAFALVLMLGVVACSGILAVLQDAFALALFGTTGGFLAPVLASTGGGSHVMLFSYYALLNAGILGIAWFRAWRVLNLAGFLFTFVIGSLWGYHYYRPELFSTTEPFLVLFFLFYVAIAVLFAQRQQPKLRGYVDGGLVFGVPLVAFGLQAALVRDFEYGLAWSALALGAFYIGSTAMLWHRGRAHLRLLTESFLALGIVFASLAIPLALDGRWTATAWSLEGAALVWIGLRQGRRLPRAFGVLLQLGGGLALLIAGGAPRVLPILNGTFLSACMVAAAGLFSAWYLRSKQKDLAPWEALLPVPLMLWGLAWWVGAGLNDIDWYLTGRTQGELSLAFVAVTAFAAGRVGARLTWRELALTSAALLPILVLVALSQLTDSLYTHPFGGWGILVWPLALAIQYALLWHLETTWPRWIIHAWHPVSLWLLLLLATWELQWLIGQAVPDADTWRNIAWALIPGLAVATLWRYGGLIPWPVRRHFRGYAVTGLAPVAVYLYLWTIAASRLPGTAVPLPYVPLINPLDLAQLFALLALTRWCSWLSRAAERPSWWPRQALWLSMLGAGGFLWLNTLVARSVHFWDGVRYSIGPLYHSMVFQAAAAILWTLTALPLMVVANRRGVREPWLAGAALLAAVVLKLFLVDLSGIGTLARIVSFLVVGALMLLIGYLAPLPPRTEVSQP